jgi:large subunit ribosomal protein L2
MFHLKLYSLCVTLHHKGGRNSKGQITVPRRGDLLKKKTRILDLKRRLFPTHTLLLLKIMKVPQFTAKIGLLKMPAGFVSFILIAEKTCTTLDTMMTKWHRTRNPWNESCACDQKNLATRSFKQGYSGLCSILPLGSTIYNVEIIPGTGAKLVRSAGTSAVLLSKKKFPNRVVLRLKTGELRMVHRSSVAVVGTVSHSGHHLRHHKNAGEVRRLGFRPNVRASAKNPVDHPMGGRTKGGCPSVSKKGKLSVGPPTRRISFTNTMIMMEEELQITRTN